MVGISLFGEGSVLDTCTIFKKQTDKEAKISAFEHQTENKDWPHQITTDAIKVRWTCTIKLQPINSELVFLMDLLSFLHLLTRNLLN